MIIWPLLVLLQGLACSLLWEEDDFNLQVLWPLPFCGGLQQCSTTPSSPIGCFNQSNLLEVIKQVLVNVLTNDQYAKSSEELVARDAKRSWGYCSVLCLGLEHQHQKLDGMVNL